MPYDEEMDRAMRAFFHHRVTVSPGVQSTGLDVKPYIERHVAGDWGDMSNDDKQATDKALAAGSSFQSRYNTHVGDLLITTYPKAMTDDPYTAITLVSEE